MRIIILLTGILMCVTQIQAQSEPETSRVKDAKIKFFNEKLNLTPDESKKFWPVYNDYQSRKNKLTSERKNIMNYYLENSSNMTSAEISESLDRYIKIQKEETLLLEQYNEKFKQILADEKVLKIYITEIQFRNYLLKQLRTRQEKMNIRK